MLPLHLPLNPSLGEVIEKAKVSDKRMESILFLFDKSDFRERLTFLMEELSTDLAGIAKIKGVNRERLMDLFSDDGSGHMLTEEAIAIFVNPKNSCLKTVLKRPKTGRMDLPIKTIELNGKSFSFRQFVEFLQREVSPDISKKRIAEFAGISKGRFHSLLKWGNMTAEEVRSFQRFYADSSIKTIELNGESFDFRQYVKLLQREVSPGIPQKKIIEHTGITANRFRRLIEWGNMRFEEVCSFQHFYFKLKSGEISYASYVPEKPKTGELEIPSGSSWIKFSETGLELFIADLKKKRPGLTDREIAEAAVAGSIEVGFDRCRVMLKGNLKFVRPEEVEAIHQVPIRLEIDDIRN